jgi:hypothetical protein
MKGLAVFFAVEVAFEMSAASPALSGVSLSEFALCPQKTLQIAGSRAV